MKNYKIRENDKIGKIGKIGKIKNPEKMRNYKIGKIGKIKNLGKMRNYKIGKIRIKIQKNKNPEKFENKNRKLKKFKFLKVLGNNKFKN
tara:strand:+ start:430 stop:696 length:267 start_codon:yes stop_codon:yes gene_type:complete